MLEDMSSVLLNELIGLLDVFELAQTTVRLSIAAFLGGALGYEREIKSKSAGIRTHMLVAVGTALFIVSAQQAGVLIGDMSRILQGVVQGIGFLGAGAIIVGDRETMTRGLTTAASVWAAAGIGMAAGLGMGATALVATCTIIVILHTVPKVIPKKDTRNNNYY